MRNKNLVLTSNQLRQLESKWINDVNSNWAQVLMELAGFGVYQSLEKYKLLHLGKIAIICSNGNNGGDGLVIARHLIQNGFAVDLYLIKPKTEFSFNSPEACNNFTILKQIIDENRIHYITDVELLNWVDYNIIIDAIFGTGLNKPISGLYAKVIEKINASNKFIIAVDMPSGINADNGQIMEVAIKAKLTYTFGYYKAGLFCHPGYEYAGKIILIDIGLPDPQNLHPKIKLTNKSLIKKILPHRYENSNKGSFGSVLTIACSNGMLGSGYLSALSALKTGCGLSYLACPISLVKALPVCELIYYPLAESNKLTISKDAVINIGDLIDAKNALVIGPGLSQNSDTKNFMVSLLSLIKQNFAHIPQLYDADALNIIAGLENIDLGGNAIITPHPKEMARLLKTTVAQIQHNRIDMALSASQKFNCVVVLKGSHTIICDPQNNVYINLKGNSGMAKAGSGDVLSGMIGSLLAQGLNCFNAAILGVYLHSLAGDIASLRLGKNSMLPSDIINNLALAFKKLS